MASWAKPGVKVVCIAPPSGNRHLLPVTGPAVGGVYTIRAVVSGHDKDRDRVGLLLEEIHNPKSPTFGVEYGFYIERFRPLITKTQEQDIEMFLRIASKAPSNMEMVE